jgi:hypothetical protein
LIENFRYWLHTRGSGLCGFPQEWLALRGQ